MSWSRVTSLRVAQLCCLVVIGLSAAGCPEDVETRVSCDRGVVRPCECDGGAAGTQTCGAGNSYGACVCADTPDMTGGQDTGGADTALADTSSPDSSQDTGAASDLPPDSSPLDTGTPQDITIGDDAPSDTATAEVGEDVASGPDVSAFLDASDVSADVGVGTSHLRFVHALDEVGSVDVYLGGISEPVLEGVAPLEASQFVEVPSGVDRVFVFVAGSEDAGSLVSCTGWVPLVTDAYITALSMGASTGCDLSAGDGATIAFEQAATAGSPFRFAHAGIDADIDINKTGAIDLGEEFRICQPADDWRQVDDLLELSRFEQAASSVLVPACNSGCAIDFHTAVQTEGDPIETFFDFTVDLPSEAPADGEVLLVLLGTATASHPSLPEALRILRVDFDSETRIVQRHPEIAYWVSEVPAGPSSFELGVGDSPMLTYSYSIVNYDDAGNPTLCAGTCPMCHHDLRPGEWTYDANGAQRTVNLEAGKRYLIVFGGAFDIGEGVNSEIFLLEDFDRASGESGVQALHQAPNAGTLSWGEPFGGDTLALFPQSCLGGADCSVDDVCACPDQADECASDVQICVEDAVPPLPIPALFEFGEQAPPGVLNATGTWALRTTAGSGFDTTCEWPVSDVGRYFVIVALPDGYTMLDLTSVPYMSVPVEFQVCS